MHQHSRQAAILTTITISFVLAQYNCHKKSQQFKFANVIVQNNNLFESIEQQRKLTTLRMFKVLVYYESTLITKERDQNQNGYKIPEQKLPVFLDKITSAI